MLTAVWFILGTLAGAALLTGLLWVVYWGACIFERIASSGWGWLIIPNLCVGPFVGAGLGLVGAVHYCGYDYASKTVAVFAGFAALVFLFYFYATNNRDELPSVYTWRQGIPVVARYVVEVIGVLFFLVPISLLVALGLVVWGLMGR